MADEGDGAGAARMVLVLGMHRSGTSALTRAAALLGLGLPQADDLYTAPDNPLGHWESRTLLTASETLLRAVGGTWFAPPPSALLHDDRRAGARRRQLRRAFSRSFEQHPSVWKDPRLCLVWGAWRAALDIEPVALVVHREPAAVARSLASRDGFDLEHSLALWERYAHDALAVAATMPSHVVAYEAVLTDPRGRLGALQAWLASQGIVEQDERRLVAAAGSIVGRPPAAPAGSTGHPAVDALVERLYVLGDNGVVHDGLAPVSDRSAEVLEQVRRTHDVKPLRRCQDARRLARWVLRR